MTLSKALEVPGTRERPRFDSEAGALAGSRCTACGVSSWPARAICHACGSPDSTQGPLAATGRLQSRTTVWIARPGIPAPYTIAMVELDDGVRVFGHLRDAAETPIGAAVRVVVGDEDVEGPPFWFAP